MRLEVKRVCVATDFSKHAEHLLLYSAQMAENFGATLHLLHVVDDVKEYGLAEKELHSVTAANALAGAVASAKRRLETLPPEETYGELEIVRDVVRGVPYLEIVRYAKESAIDMLILGTHGRTGLKHLLLGSVAERVVRTAPCPVLTVRHPDDKLEIAE